MGSTCLAELCSDEDFDDDHVRPHSVVFHGENPGMAIGNCNWQFPRQRRTRVEYISRPVCCEELNLLVLSREICEASD